MMRMPFVLLSALFALALPAALPCLAALGDTEESVVADQIKFRATRTVVSQPGYSVHEISRPDGTLIREYVSPGGKVFGVSWKGPSIPDLSQLLGSNFAEFRNNLQRRPGRRKIAVVRGGDLVVESTGHARAFYGRAYLNSMLPGGATQETVQ